MSTRMQGYKSIKKVAGDLLLSPSEEYYNNRTPLNFLCKSCGERFVNTAFHWKKTENGKNCLHCKKRLKVQDNSSKQTFINACKKIHRDYYQYELLPENFNAKEKIQVICPKHGPFTTTADAHKNRGTGCPHCKIEKITTVNRSSRSIFIEKANKKHEHKYNYSFVKYINAKTPVSIICPQHGVFEQTPDSHLRGNGCPVCTTTSKPVQQILKILKRHKVEYRTEHSFEYCPRGEGGRTLRFDVFIPSFNLCVEYDGPQHFSPIKFGSQTDEDAQRNFEITQKHDSIKTAFCENNNVDLIRIPFTDKNPDATVINYIKMSLPSRYVLSWANFETIINNLISHIKSYNYEEFVVYGIARGGLMFAVPVSYKLEPNCKQLGILKYSRYDANDKTVEGMQMHNQRELPIFLIDDLISSGETMKKCISFLQFRYKKAKIHPIVVFGNENEQNIEYIHQHPGKWIVFPYE